ncbi:MAG: DNA primase large subunit PriL [Candidatus Methanoplasma sp.]|jgi:DNA primase large subunit|nr:DNA primase large subunit PriL [Candidatus Methanoplasma sp.]
MDTQRAARYPFLRDAIERVGDTNPMDLAQSDLPQYEDARKRGMERVRDAIKSHRVGDAILIDEYSRSVEMLSYPYARMIVSCIDDRFLTKRYALAEASHMSEIVSTVDGESAIPIATELGIASRRDPAAPDKIYMHFADYLKYAHTLKASEWKLVNSDLKRGEVCLDVAKFSRLLQNAIQIKIEEGLPIGMPPELLKALGPVADDAAKALAALKKELSPTGGEGMREGLLPPCMKSILASAQNGMNLPHSARFALVSFLNSLGLSYEQIISLFAQSPDFDEGKSGYQIRHITSGGRDGEGYTPPECATMKTYGICYDPDALCAAVSHPLSYYRAKSRDSGRQ